MTRGLTITKEVHFRSMKRGRKVIVEGPAPKRLDLGKIPRISRLMALAIHMDELVRRGEVVDYADLARLAHVSRARITQIMNLLLLAPEIQEALLFLPLVHCGRDAVAERQVRPIATIPDWRKQRVMWAELNAKPATKANP